MSVKLTISLVLVVVVAVHSASILEYLEMAKTSEHPSSALSGLLREDHSNRNCLCKGPACVCCVDFNITFVDLGGPGCVHMKYLSPEDGFSVNVSYGKNVIHSAKIQGTNPEPICLQMFGTFAQMCAKFSELAPTADGLRGCLDLEPRIMSEPQLEFPVGCFRSSNGGMEMEDPKEPTEAPEIPESPDTQPQNPSEEQSSEEEDDGFDAESFIVNMVQTAEQGFAFFSSLMDLPNRLNITTKPTTEAIKNPQETSTTESVQRRALKYILHPNLL